MAVQQQVAKIKKKQWFSIVAPKQFENSVIGETLVYDPQAMIGKTLSHSLMNLTGDVKKQNISIHFKVTEIEGDKAKTSIVGYELAASSLKRFVRRNSEKIILSFVCETADKVYLRIKPLIITRGDVKGSVAARLRHMLTQYVVRTVNKLKYDELINDMITHKFQSAIREGLHKIYPIKICEVRFMGITEKGKGDMPQFAPLPEVSKPAAEVPAEPVAEVTEAAAE
ncbi:MAG TPA: hypothetical protein VJI97_03585 [Candidatus Nanoarchaeia archaeon]|nr:hypothetical protein [Candidatus Nanoarchaeia archaeon]